jgi:hypothetical protein
VKRTYVLALLSSLLIGAGLYWVFNPTDPGRVAVQPQSDTSKSLVGSSSTSLPAQPPIGQSPQEPPAESATGISPQGVPISDASEDLHGPATPPPKAFLEGWDSPQTLLVFTGEQHGYVEPCGCSLKQLGGVSRRADFFRQLSVRGWPVLACDLGGLVNRPSRKQGKLKLQLSLQTLKDMHYSAVVPGPEELRNGIELITYEERPPFVACNVVLGGDRDLGVIVPQTIVEAGGLKVGITGLLGKSH